MRKYTILLHVSQGLEKLHDMGVLHRDLKGGNILLNGEAGHCSSCGVGGNWKICDFGESRVLKTPTLEFRGHVECPAGLRQRLIEEKRLKHVTSAVLQQKGCYHYCWLHPRELSDKRWVEGKPLRAKSRLPVEVAPPLDSFSAPPELLLDGTASGEYQDQYGGLAFFFGSKDNGDPQDRIFLVRDIVDEPTVPPATASVSASGGAAGSGEVDGTQGQFPEAIGPFRLVPTTGARRHYRAVVHVHSYSHCILRVT